MTEAQDEPANAEVIASAVSLIRRMRGALVPDQHADVLREHMAVVGGALLLMADRMECRNEVDQIVMRDAERFAVLRAGLGLSGRA